MIQWLVQSMADLAGQEVEHAFLSAEEAATFAKLNMPKRREDWLLGRWTAKQLVHSYLQTERGEAWPLDRISIGVEASGAPYVRLNLAGRALQSSGLLARSFPEEARLPVSISISHSHGTAFCALSDQAGTCIGADIEEIAPRAATFIADFFTAAEIRQVEQTAEALRPLLATAIWSGKESMLKAVQQGLRIDTRSVECYIEPLPLPVDQWQPFAIRTDSACEPIWATKTVWQGWWRSVQGYILTMAAGGEA